MRLPHKIQPTNGISYLLHLALVLILPLAVFTLVRLDFVQPAFSVIVLSKWRMFAVRPRFWASNIRANAVDLMVGLSIVVFMTHSGSLAIQVLWTVLYAIWLLSIKPGSSIPMITIQAGLGQLAALSALFLLWTTGPPPIMGITFFCGLFSFLAARHFLDTFDEPYARMLAYLWGYFGAAMGWLLSHWLLFYRSVAQATLLLCTLGYGLAVLYYLDHNDKLSKGIRRQFVFIMVAIVVVILAGSKWGNKVV